jgi:2'-5' RNA ligase/predicted GNAT family acetyltransferase
MSRPRLGVVLLIPGPADVDVTVLQRAVGARPRVAPHLTLVPPVNVRADRVDDALAAVRRAAASVRPMHVHIGPAATFWPVRPVLYLAVGGELEQLRRLRDAVFVEPLAHVLDHEFVPHVTVGESLGDVDLPALAAALDAYHQEITFERVTVLEERDDRRWEPIADAPLGGPHIVGRGGLPVELATGQVLDPDAASLLGAGRAGHLDPAGRTRRAEAVVVTARREGAVVGVATAMADDELWLERIVVDPAVRGQGVGRHLLAEVERIGADRSCRRAFLVCPAGGAAQSWCAGHGWTVDLPLGRWRHGRDFVRMVRALPG